MNIVTVCLADSWIDTHLARWRKTIYRHMPDAKCYLVMPYDAATYKRTQQTARRLMRHFADIKLVKSQSVYGFAIFMDALRANILRAFGLKEALYLDADIDVVGQLNTLPDMDPHADVLWTPNEVERDAVTRALAAYGLPDTKPYAEPAVLYLRKDFGEEYRAIIEDNKLDWNDYLPSVNVWNVLIRKYIPNNFMLPLEYNTMAQKLFIAALTEAGEAIKLLHFCGKQMKLYRLAYDLSEWPNKLTITRDGTSVDVLNWDRDYEG